MASLDMVLDRNEMVDNPTPRVPVALVLDVSGSMMGPPIDELTEGVRAFFQSLEEDEVARYAAEVSLITFGTDVKRVRNFATIDKCDVALPPAKGKTSLGSAVSMALSDLEERKDLYRTLGVDYYQPWLVIMTDGKPTDEVEEAVSGVQALVGKNRLTVFPIAIGEKADMKVLARFSPKRVPLRLKELRFREFFRWLSSSVSRVSQSIPGENVELDLSGIKGWANL